ncbi:MAG: 50S ribosomal protein L17 [Candidatus Yanofskybacteria bacterium RIFCSPHIGHO2_02_FULL_50_12]|uniref:Large ribosomal subunit protein bL17 n=1 Tax=Candidatus Yanofskybacteria bacterium RIFCSPHIGHO2_02_FULL_50_12 TaxID=1802685 RepID=A0A1F8FUE7_9BACT|nr:MAG: 50S ribosomal protein L17 [Candidatus Yanofskybacteria bacterium RIFCSPHIGHO2_02_FULL_50_12]
MRRGNHRKFGLETNQRNALYKSLATALIEHGKIKTTEAKAKSLVRFVERLITLAKKQNLNARRELLGHVGEKAVGKLMNDIAKQYGDRNGGYTRIIKLGARRGDSADMAIVEFTA